MPQLLAACIVLCSVTAAAAADQPRTGKTEAAALPKVVLVGDSIRLSYTAVATQQLAGQAVVVSPRANGGDSSNVLTNLKRWVLPEQPAVVCFNCGIHDTKKFREAGRFQVPPEQYEANLRAIVKQIRSETTAVVLFATTTPILDDRAAAARKGRDYELLEASVVQYNGIATRVMQELKVPVVDLHAVLAKPAPPATTATLIAGDGVHLTPAGRKLLGQSVATFVAGHLPQQPE